MIPIESKMYPKFDCINCIKTSPADNFLFKGDSVEYISNIFLSVILINIKTDKLIFLALIQSIINIDLKLKKFSYCIVN